MTSGAAMFVGGDDLAFTLLRNVTAGTLSVTVTLV
jgi:hypothetical protein